MTILLRVRVPVLSEQSMSIPAIASIDASRVTIAPSLRIPRRLVRRRAAPRGKGGAGGGGLTWRACGSPWRGWWW